MTPPFILVSTVIVVFGALIIWLGISNSRFSRPWYIPRSYDEENVFGRFLTIACGVGFALIGLLSIIFKLAGW